MILINFKNFIFRLTHWEYWPSYMFYLPILPYLIYLMLKSKSISFFTNVNPCIKYSGIGSESKMNTLNLFPKSLVPNSILIHKNCSLDKLTDTLVKNNINFPIVAKPDIGFRGLLVKKIDTLYELKTYLKNNKLDTIVQSFLPHKNEFGIFVVKSPKTDTFEITSLTKKKKLVIIGDGVQSIEQLTIKNNKNRLYYNMIKETTKNEFYSIPDKNKIAFISHIGNHSKGSEFINYNNQISTLLTSKINSFCKNIEGFNYGRFDIKADSLSCILDSKFKIIELNGIISEPTHIYDSNTINFPRALKTICINWDHLQKISKNQQSKNYTPIPLSKLMKEYFLLKKHLNIAKNS